MFTSFFINRPIFASVLSIFVTLAGLIALWGLPIAQYPDITPPTVEVSAIYPGANSQVVADTVAAPIEQQVNGVENMLYMSSQCTNDGNYSLTVTFQNGVDLNMAQVLVQNRVALATPILPDLVKRRGVTVKKKSPNVLMIVNLFSTKKNQDRLTKREQDELLLYLSNYATIQLKDELSRLKGVGDITYLGQRDYSMRLWLDPNKMVTRGLTAADVQRAIEQQNTQVAAGQLGQPPVNTGLAFQFTMSTMGRLSEVEQFDDMLLKADALGRLVKLSDVAKSELGAQSYDQTCTLNGKPSVALSVYQLPGSNALEVAKAVKKQMKELSKRFPPDIDYAIVYDTTPFIDQSINEVWKTLRDAVILVAFVVLLFLQNWRSAIIPLLAVPVAIVGTFVIMAAMGFSLNNLTLFGLVLAIGIVVDDAIVVVEAVEHHIERGLSPRDATLKAMEQVSGPVIAVGLVLSAVFIPCAFISGITGQFFRQFALTIAVSTVLSAFNSLTLSPALTALLLRPRDKGSAPPLPKPAFWVLGTGAGILLAPLLTPWLEENFGPLPYGKMTLRVWGGVLGGVVGGVFARPANRVLGTIFRLFNNGFNRATDYYARAVGGLLRVSVIALLVYGGLLYLTYHSFVHTPRGFIPQQDMGYLLVNVQLPDSASLQRTEKVMAEIDRITRGDKKDPTRYPGIPGVKHTVAVSGQSLLLGANAPNFGAMFVMLDDFDKRTDHELSGDAIAARLQSVLQSKIQDGVINVFGAPPLEGLGTAGGFKIIVEDRGDTGLKSLQNVADKIVAAGGKAEGLQDLFTSFRADTPWLYLNIDRTQAKTMRVNMGEVFSTLQGFLGGYYVNDFNRFGRTWQVNVQAMGDYRKTIETLRQLPIRSDSGRMVPFGTIARVEERSGPVLLMRYNMYPSAAINVTPAPGVSSGQAIDKMAELVDGEIKKEFRSMRREWTELALLQLETGNTAMYVFILAVVLVFLVLAAQYESWSLPLAVILVVPMCLLCSVAGVLMARMDVNIFTQVGFIVLVGLACKNAILIVEFAKARREAGTDRYAATLAACRLRLRPIIMTSLAFILGVVPLVISEGAGAEMRRTLGTAVFAGMLGVTLFGIFLTPVFYYVIQWFSDWRAQLAGAEPEANGVPREPTAGHHG
jgi:multidrug efflux pump subunit AcrB